MSQAEFVESFAALIDTSLSAMGLYFTAVTGYLIAAYLAGAKLNISQLSIVSTLFVVFSLAMAFTGFALAERAILLEIEYEGARDALDWSSYLLLVAQILGILASLKFMMETRSSS